MSEETKAALSKVGISWVGGVAGMTLSDWLLLATLVYTVLQIFFLILDRWNRRDRRGRK